MFRPPLKLHIGCPSRVPDVSHEDIIKLIDFLDELGIRELDTCPEYPLTDPGASEKLFALLGLTKKSFWVASKVLYPGNGDGAHTSAAVSKSVSQSLSSLGVEKMNTLYCRGPDRTTPLVEQAAAFDAEYRKGTFGKLGLCDFPVELLEQWLQIAEENNFVKPSVFQGQYNVLCRTYEDTLFPLLRKHKIKFVAHGILAGGLLTGKKTLSPTTEDLDEAIGIDDADWRKYDKPSMHAAIRQMSELCKPHNIEIRDAALRWLVYHSVLEGGPILSREKGDAVIIAPFNISETVTYAEAYKEGPLPDEVAKGLSALWESVKPDATSLVP